MKIILCPINTERLKLVQLTLHDNSFILALTNSKEWIEFIGNRNIHTTADADKYIQKLLDNPSTDYWVVKLQNSLIPIGVITFIKREYLAHYDIGFAFLPEYAKQGYAFEASTAVLKELANTQKTLLAITVKENINSINLLRKLGFLFEKEVESNGEILAQYIFHY